MSLRFNLNELFRTPHDYDLLNGNYSMGSMMLMTQLKENAADAFTLNTYPDAQQDPVHTPIHRGFCLQA
ncbi:MAG: hypothetical protein IPI00_12535 [Flavobacteriales bacterium]|nr:hypothetical protein [Flavobacteriales bacterium]